jgi:hypothetical protein
MPAVAEDEAVVAKELITMLPLLMIWWQLFASRVILYENVEPSFQRDGLFYTCAGILCIWTSIHARYPHVTWILFFTGWWYAWGPIFYHVLIKHTS